MNILTRLAFREIAGNRRFSLFFIFNLAIGLLGFVALDAFKVSLEKELQSRSKFFLAADLSVSANRPLSEEENRIVNEAIGPDRREGLVTEFNSMATAGGKSSMVEVRAVDGTYPFYGQLDLGSGAIIRGGAAADSALEGVKPLVWIYPEVADQLSVGKGDSLRIGAVDFEVRDIVQNDTGNSFRGALLAPRVYVGRRHLAKTGLLGRKSAVYIRRLYQLPEKVDLNALGDRLFDGLKDPAVVVETHFSRSDQVGRGLLGYVTDYLGLISLVALFLAALGTAYLFRSFISLRLREIAILLSLGITHAAATRIYLTQALSLGISAALVALLASIPLLPGVAGALKAFVPFDISPGLRWQSALMALLLGAGAAVFTCLPLLMGIRNLKANVVFREEESTTGGTRQLTVALTALPGVLLYWALAVWQAHSWVVGSLFLAAMLGSLAGHGVIGWVGLTLLGRIRVTGRISLKLALRSLARNRLSSVSCFISIGLGSLLIGLIPQLQNNIESEMMNPPGFTLPSFFLFDIQDDQIEALRTFVGERHVPLLHVSPMIRARLLTVNGKSFEKLSNLHTGKTREADQAARSRNRSFNLTYRAALTDAESVSSGRIFQGTFDPAGGKPAEISVEKEFAERLDLHLGDRLEFDVQGVPVGGTITSVRRIRWTSFQPNFFLLFQPGVLEEAPKSYLAAIPKQDLNQRLRLLREISERFPNVSMVDVNLTLQKTLRLILQMSWVLKIMAALAILVGFVVLFSIANHQANTRRTEMNLLKVLGARFSQVRGIIRWEFGILGFSSAAVGMLLSFGVSYLISVVVFDGLWFFWWKVPLAGVFFVTLLSVLISHWATRRVLRERPLALLQEAP